MRSRRGGLTTAPGGLTISFGRYQILLRRRQAQPIHIFLSYSCVDDEAALRLYADLSAHHEFNIWFAKHSLMVGDFWADRIHDAIRGVDFFVALQSRRSVQRCGYRDIEIQRALEIQGAFSDGRAFIHPVHLDDCQSPFTRLRDFHHVDLFPNWNHSVARLSKVILARSRHAMAPPAYGR